MKQRHKEAKAKIKGIKKAKIKFFDSFYGATLKTENIRLDNLWAGYIYDEKFTTNLEKFADDQI